MKIEFLNIKMPCTHWNTIELGEMVFCPSVFGHNLMMHIRCHKIGTSALNEMFPFRIAVFFFAACSQIAFIIAAGAKRVPALIYRMASTERMWSKTQVKG